MKITRLCRVIAKSEHTKRDYDEFVYSTLEEVDELYPKVQRFIEEIDELLKA